MDVIDAEEIKKHLMQTSEEFRELVHQHQVYKSEVAKLEHKPDVTNEDEIEEHRLKKLKLQLKDRMEEMVRSYKAQHV